MVRAYVILVSLYNTLNELQSYWVSIPGWIL